MSLDAEATWCLTWSARVCCGGLAWQSLELWRLGPELRDGHLLGRTRQSASTGSRGAPDQLFLAVRAAAALAGVFVSFGTAAGAVLLIALFVGQWYFNRRFALVLTNADHLNLLSLGGLAAAGWPDASFGLRVAALTFIAFHGLFGYVAAGVDKLRAANWRSGERLLAVLQDSSYRAPWLADLVRRPPIARLLAWGTIWLEVLFPLALVLPTHGFAAFLAAGIFFHAVIAVAMGLPIFLWAFGATYPAMFFVHEWLAAWWQAGAN